MRRDFRLFLDFEIFIECSLGPDLLTHCPHAYKSTIIILLKEFHLTLGVSYLCNVKQGYLRAKILLQLRFLGHAIFRLVLSRRLHKTDSRFQVIFEL